jgi:hypothetical protein
MNKIQFRVGSMDKTAARVEIAAKRNGRRSRLPGLIAAIVMSVAGAVPAVAQGTSPVQGQPRGEAASGTVDLRPRFETGQQIRFKMRMESSGTDTMDGAGEASTSTKQEIGLLLRVKDVNPETGAVLDLVYESLKFSLDSPIMGRVDFDSSKPATGGDASPVEAMLRPMVGLTLSVRTDKDGNITEVKAPESAGGAGAMLHQFTGADVVKNMFGPIVSLRGGTGRASVGEKWTNESRIDSPMGAMKISTTNTLLSHAEGKANIDIKGGVNLTPGGMPGMPAATVKESSLSGKAVWDTAKGMLRSVQTEQRIAFETEMAGVKGTSKQIMKLDVQRFGE